MPHPRTCRDGWMMPDIPHLQSVEDTAYAFPSVFANPLSNSSICSFVLALPTCSSPTAAVPFSSLSMLALLSVSMSLKSRNVDDDQLRFAPGASLVTTLTAALQSLLSSTENPVAEFVAKSRHKSLQTKNGKLSASKQQSTKTVSTQNVYWQTSGDDNVDGLMVEDCSQNSSAGVSELKSIKDGPDPVRQSGLDKVESMSKCLMAGAVSTIVARTFVAPLERLKLEYIVGGAKHNWTKVIQEIWIAEGLGGFWKGNVLNLLRMVPFKSINFLTYDMFCKDLLERQGKEEVTNFDRLMAGAASGATATLLCLPLDTIRTRLIAPGGEALGGMLGCFHQMVQNEGCLSLYKGLLPALLSMVPAGAVFYGVYDILKAAYLQSPKVQKEFQKRMQVEKEMGTYANGTDKIEKMSHPQPELGPVRTLVYGAIAGACAEIVTYPLEVVRRQLQLQQATSKMGLIAAFQIIIERDGCSALFSGVVPSTAQVLPSAALSYLVYEFTKSILKIS